MTTRSDPAAVRWLVGAELANFRAETGLSLTEAASATGISRPKLGHMETGRYQQNPADVATALKEYGAAQEDIDRVASLAGSSARKAWWAPWKGVLSNWLHLYLGLEGMAESIFTYEPNIIPGLLQTRDYAQAITTTNSRLRPDHAKRFVDLRMARTARLSDPLPLHLHAIIGEAALRLGVGTPEIRRAQYEHLLKLAKRPHITVQIVRPEDGVHNALLGHFAILNFAAARSVAYIELQEHAIYVSDPEQIWAYTGAAESVRRVALSPRDSNALLKSAIDRETT